MCAHTYTHSPNFRAADLACSVYRKHLPSSFMGKPAFLVKPESCFLSENIWFNFQIQIKMQVHILGTIIKYTQQTAKNYIL